MPSWVQIILAAGAVVTAVGVLWSRVIHPAIRAAAAAEVMLPLLRDLTITFRDTPQAFQILDEIVAQFRTDSGSSLRDVVNRLEQGIKDSRVADEALKVGVEATRQLAAMDREKVDRLIILLDRLYIRVDAVGDTSLRIEEAAGHVADDLAARKAATDARRLAAGEGDG